jgi:hypothetical protein
LQQSAGARGWLRTLAVMADAVLNAVIGAGGALFGSVVGAVTTYFVQKRLIAAQTSSAVHKEFLAKQLVSLQELNLAIDFALGNQGKTEGGPVGEMFIDIVKEAPRHLAFLPNDLRDDARKLFFEFFKGAREGEVNLDLTFMNDLRARALAQIDKTFLEYRHDS